MSEEIKNPETQGTEDGKQDEAKQSARGGRKAAAAQAEPTRKRVIIRKPFGTTDSHIFIGFNNFEGQFAYDAPVFLPVDVIEYLRSLDRVEYRADDDGNPQPSYSPMLAIIDAPEG